MTRRNADRLAPRVERIESGIAPIEVAVFNIGANVRHGVTQTTSRVGLKVWEMACFGGHDHLHRRHRQQEEIRHATAA